MDKWYSLKPYVIKNEVGLQSECQLSIVFSTLVIIRLLYEWYHSVKLDMSGGLAWLSYN